MNRTVNLHLIHNSGVFTNSIRVDVIFMRSCYVAYCAISFGN